jgi:hypothetical protein
MMYFLSLVWKLIPEGDECLQDIHYKGMSILDYFDNTLEAINLSKVFCTYFLF